MFDRPYLKERAKAAFKKNYWLCVVVALILGWAVGGGGSASGFSRGFSSSYNSSSNYDSYDYDFEDPDDIEDIFNQYGHGDYDPQMLQAVSGIVIVVVLIVSLISIAVSIFIRNPLLVGCKRYFTLNAFENPDFKEVGFGFKKGQYMNIVKVEFMKNLFIFLWSLLCVIPGIIKAYEYYMVDYILTEDPTIGYKEALEMSKKMMDGYKWETFVLELSFIGWQLLAGCTCFILSVFWVNPYMYATYSELFLYLRGNYFGPNVKPYHTPAFAGGYSAPNPSNQFNSSPGFGQAYNPQQPTSFGQTPDNTYGQPTTPDAYGQPVTPDAYGQPYNPDSAYGQNPADPYGTQGPADPYGTQNPADSYGSTSSIDPYGTQNPADSYGSTSSVDPYGTQNPVDPYGTQNPADPYGTTGSTDPYGTSDSYGTDNTEGSNDSYNPYQ